MKKISQEKLENMIDTFENKGWRCCNGSDSFNVNISAYSPTNYFWCDSYILERKENKTLIGEAKDAQRYINLIKIHSAKFPWEWSEVKRNF